MAPIVEWLIAEGYDGSIPVLPMSDTVKRVAGDAIRLAGGMAYAHLIAVTVMRDGAYISTDAIADTSVPEIVRRSSKLGPNTLVSVIFPVMLISIFP